MAVQYDFTQMKSFFQKLEKAANGDFRVELENFLNGIGFELLRVVEDEIIRKKVMDTRLLLNSFHKGDAGNVWELDSGGLTLEVGTNVEYAKWVNDGHAQKQGRFVPGYWNGDRFTYVPNAKTGMVLKEKWVPGAHYWESAIQIIEVMYPKLAESMLQQWIDSYFKF